MPGASISQRQTPPFITETVGTISSNINLFRVPLAEPILFGLEVHANLAAADAKFGPVLEHGRAHALLFVERAIGGIHVLQIDVSVTDFEQAVVSGNFRILQGNVRAFAA